MGKRGELASVEGERGGAGQRRRGRKNKEGGKGSRRKCEEERTVGKGEKEGEEH